MLVTRVITGLVLGVAVTAAILLLPTGQAAALLALLWLAGAWEWAGLARLGNRARLAYTAGLLLLMLAASGPVTWSAFDVVLGVALAAWGVALVGVLTFPRRIPAAWVLVAGPIALLPAWLVLKTIHGAAAQGPALALMALVLVWAADIGAYAVGRRLGRLKLAPKVSPGKTWEGVSGGVLLTLVAAWVGARWLDLELWPFLFVAMCTGLVSVVGDLTVSMLKRNVGLKDSGRLLPGHGGVMDRIDGLIAAVPVYAAGLRLMGVLA